MAKSKKKSSKSKKQNQKQVKSAQAKKQTKKVSKSNASKVTVNQAPAKSSSNNSAVAFIVALIIVTVLGFVVLREPKRQVNVVEPSPNPNGQQSIEVTEPNSDDEIPGSTDYDIQGSEASAQQRARGDLQTPSSNPLQPNARIDDYENAEIN